MPPLADTPYLDVTKAFDTVSAEAVWTILECYGCPRKFVKIIKLFYEGMTGQFLTNGDTTLPFEIANGVKQGCVLAPVLINLFFPSMLLNALQEEGVYIKYRLKAPFSTYEA